MRKINMCQTARLQRPDLIRLQGAALVAVRNNLNKKMFADGHKGIYFFTDGP